MMENIIISASNEFKSGSKEIRLKHDNEQDPHPHGAFTFYLIKGLEGEASDENGIIYLDKLYRYVDEQLSDIGKEHPIAFITGTTNGAIKISTAPQKYNEYINKKIEYARTFYSSKDLSSLVQVIRSISDVLNVNPQHAEALDIKNKVSETLIEYQKAVNDWLINNDSSRTSLPDIIPKLLKLANDLHFDRVTRLDKNQIALLMSLYSVSKEEITYDAFIKKSMAIDKKLLTDAGEWNSKGLELGNLGKYDEALKRFDKAIEIYPSYAVAWRNKGFALYNMGKYDEAIKCYDRAIEIDPGFERAWYSKGNALFDLTKYDEAIKCYSKAIEIAKGKNYNYVDAWSSQGNAFFNLKKYDESIKCYDKAIEIDPNYKWAWYGKGNVLLDLKRYDEAIQLYDKSIGIDPRFERAWYGKGNVLLDLKRYDEAIKCFNKTIEIYPNYTDAWHRKGNALYDLRKYSKAIECYDKAIDVNPYYAAVWYSRGNVFFDLKNYEEAIKNYEEAIKIDENHAHAWYREGDALYTLRKYNDAIKCYDRAIELNPKNPYPWIGKGTGLRAISNYLEAEHCYNEALYLDSKNIDALNGLGLIYSEYMYDYDKALQLVRKALEIEPNNFFIEANIAENLIKIGSYEEGRKYALKALNETQDSMYLSIIRLLILSSYLLENDTTKGSKELAKFFYYYRNLNEGFTVEGKWVFNGLINVIKKSKSNLQTKFLLLALIDLFLGKIDRQRLSFFEDISDGYPKDLLLMS